MSKLGLLFLAAIAVALAVIAPADAASRACNSGDLQGSRAPAMLRDHGLDTQDGPLIAGTQYRVVVVQELAIGDHAQPVDGSVNITAPNGPALQPVSENGRPAYDFTPAAGTLRLVVNWEEEVGSPGSGDVCSASQAFDIPVVAPTKPQVKGTFSKGAGSNGSSFLLRLLGKEPQVPDKVQVILRARKGTTKPPAAKGGALAKFTFTPTGDGHFSTSSSSRQLKNTFYADTVGGGVQIYPYPNIAFGRTLRFAFSIEVIQNGERLGGMRSGATCKRIQFTGHSAVKCKAVGLKQRP